MDPSSGWFNSDVLTLEELRDAPCIGLLGEVGMGKTIAVRQEATNIQSAMDPDVSADRINLGLLSDGAELRDALAGSDAVRRWREDGAVVHLLLDGLDEFVARFQRGRSALVEEVERLAGDRERLRLRVASRSAFWTPGFSNDLASAFGVEHLPLWHLAPLRTEDVVLAASDVGVESSAFLREVRRLDAGPLAARPVTLRFLLDLYASKGSFPSRRYELFEEGCRHLAEEHDEEVRESAELDLDESLALASRVAAANVFTGRPEIWLGKQAVEAPPGSISILELAGGKEALLRAGDTAVEASGENLRSVLRSTGLFASPGDNHATWAHASYAEFLAARFVQQRGLSPAQIESLLLQTGADGQRRLAPQLVETAGWIASVRPATFRMLMQSDPESLLRSDALDVSDDERRALVEELLARHDREDLDLVYTRMRLNLVHPGLAAQLTPYIDSDTHSLTARRFAVRLAAEAGVSALAEPILCVALNRNEPLGLREHAADAIVELRDGTTIETLRRFIEPGDATDERQALRASALRGLWPDRLSTEDVFASLAPPRPDMATRYSAFVGHTFPTGLTEADLPIALRWAKDANVDGTGEQPFERLIEAICTRAWEAEQETVQELLADVLTNQLDVRRESWSEDSLRVAVDASPERRRTMLGRIVRRLAQRQKGTLAIFWSRINWLRSGDATWMCNRLTSTDDTREKQAWVELIVRIWSGDHAETITILETATTEPLLLKALTPAMAVVELDSADALTQRQHWEMSTSAATPPPQHDEADKLRPALEAAKTGERDAWVHLIQLMDSVAHDDEPPRTGAWMPAFGRVAERLDAADKSSVVEGCRRFLCEGSPPGGDSLPGRTWGEVTAYRSLLLLSHLDPNALASLPSEIWIRWAPAIAGHEPTYAREFEGDVLRLAREHAQQALLSNLAGALAAEIGASRRARAHIRFVTLDEKYVSQLLLAIAADTRTPGDAVRDLLIPLLDCGSEPAWRAALEITKSSLEGEAQLERADRAAGLLLAYPNLGEWELAWDALSSSPQLVDTAVHFLADQERRGLPPMNEQQLGTLLGWMLRHHPPDTDPDESGSGVSPRIKITWLRNSLVNALTNKGTADAVAGINRLRAHFPGMTWLAAVERAARETARKVSWEPLTCAEVLALLPGRVLLRDSRDLVLLLVQEIQRIQVELHGETPAVRDVWDCVERGRYRPVGEDAFSDWLKRQLTARLRTSGVVINREVQIRRSAGPGTGARTDLHVTAVRTGEDSDLITCVVEVKAQWNTELLTAQGTQLVNRYLLPTGYGAGLYLVAWFASEMWDTGDQRSRTARRLKPLDVRGHLEKQADDLRKDGPWVMPLLIDLGYPAPAIATCGFASDGA